MEDDESRSSGLSLWGIGSCRSTMDDVGRCVYWRRMLIGRLSRASWVALLELVRLLADPEKLKYNNNNNISGNLPMQVLVYKFYLFKGLHSD